MNISSYRHVMHRSSDGDGGDGIRKEQSIISVPVLLHIYLEGIILRPFVFVKSKMNNFSEAE